MRINATGNWLLYEERAKDGQKVAVIHDWQQRKKYELALDPELTSRQIGNYYWIKSEMAVVRMDYSAFPSSYTLFWPYRDASGEITRFHHLSLPVGVFILDGLSERKDEILCGRYSEDGNLDAYLVDLKAENFNAEFFRSKRLNRRLSNASSLLTDQHGVLSFGLVNEDGGARVYSRSKNGRAWDKGFLIPKNTNFSAYDIDLQRGRVLALSNLGGERVRLGWWRLSDGNLDKLIFEDPNSDVVDVEFSGLGRRLVGVRVFQSGRPVMRYLPSDLVRYDVDFSQSFPGDVVSVIDSNERGDELVLHVGNARTPGEYYLFHTQTKEAKRLGIIAPWLASVPMGSTRVISSASHDGPAVESFLTMPPGNQSSIPLLVMPHGGPLSARDSLVYDAEVQLLAGQGYAVLRTNYRGSYGYGKHFIEQGKRQWGRGIEQDIRAAVAEALKEPRLDRKRVGIFGASYGGYSALMNVIQAPDLFQCAASFAGVTDIPLLFANSRVGNNDELRQALIDIVGSPDADMEQLKAYSPVYLYRQIHRPVFIAQGTEDFRVDLEHALRLTLMLDKAKAKYEYLEMPGTGHGFNSLGEIDTFYTALNGFLGTCLKPTPAVVMATSASAESH